MGPEQQSDVLGKWCYPMEQTSDSGNRPTDLCEQTDLIITSTFKRNHRRHQLTWQRTTPSTSEVQRKRKMPTLKLQLDYVLTKNIPLSDIRKFRAVRDVAFDSDHLPVPLSFMVRFQKRYRRAQHQPKLDLLGLKNEQCRKKFRQRVSISIGLGIRRRVEDLDSFTKCILEAAKKTLPVLTARTKFAFASAETISTYNYVCVARTTGDFRRSI